MNIYANPMQLEEDECESRHFKYMDSESKNTIRDIPNKDDYLKLANVKGNDGTWTRNGNVPSDLHQGIRDLTYDKLKLSDQHFVQSLDKLKQFLIGIQNELEVTFTKTELSKLGKVGFGAETSLKPHCVDSEHWNGEDADGHHGLFRVQGETISGLYSNNLMSLETFLNDEFFLDHSGLEDFSGDLGSREYRHILRPGIALEDINNLKNSALSEMFGEIGEYPPSSDP